MSILSDCCPPCPSVTVNTPGPPGTNGTDGADGAPGLNAFTLTTANLTLPAVNSNVTVAVADTTWMAIGQNVFISDGIKQGNFQVVAVISSTSVQLEFLGYPGDGAPGDAITSGANVSPAGLKSVVAPAATSAFGNGTVYSLTATPALLALGTTIPQVTIPTTGNYVLAAWVRYDYNAATFAANRTVTTKIRCTNTATDVPGSTRAFLTEIITTKTFTAAGYAVALIAYAGTAGDILEVWGSVSTLPTAGSLDTVEASLVAFGPF
jgi:hypothetical protein